MKAIISTALASILLATGANSEELVKAKVAVVNLDAIMQNGNFHQRIGLLSLDKDTIGAMKKIVAEIKTVQKEIIDAQDQTNLNDLQNKQQFLSRKLSLVAQRTNSRRDPQASLRDFLIANYKDKYSLILQPGASGPDTIFWNGGAEITDITEEATAKLRERLDEISGGLNVISSGYMPPSSMPARMYIPATKPAKSAPPSSLVPSKNSD